MHQMLSYFIQVYLYHWLVYNLPGTNFWNQTISLWGGGDSARTHTHTHTHHVTRVPSCHIVNTHNVTSRGTTKYSYSKWELWIFKWEKQKVIYPSASLPSPEVQPTKHGDTCCHVPTSTFAAISVFCMFPFLSQQHQLHTKEIISAPSPTFQGCSLV